MSISRTTSSAALSSRNPRKTGCRSFPSLVHSEYFTWQTNTGLTQWHRRICAAVMPAPYRSALLSGRFLKGQVAIDNDLKRADNDRKEASLKPVPTFPAHSDWSFS
jgi:hypothetical protein